MHSPYEILERLLATLLAIILAFSVPELSVAVEYDQFTGQPTSGMGYTGEEGLDYTNTPHIKSLDEYTPEEVVAQFAGPQISTVPAEQRHYVLAGICTLLGWAKGGIPQAIGVGGSIFEDRRFLDECDRWRESGCDPYQLDHDINFLFSFKDHFSDEDFAKCKEGFEDLYGEDIWEKVGRDENTGEAIEATAEGGEEGQSDDGGYVSPPDGQSPISVDFQFYVNTIRTLTIAGVTGQLDETMNVEVEKATREYENARAEYEKKHSKGNKAKMEAARERQRFIRTGRILASHALKWGDTALYLHDMSDDTNKLRADAAEGRGEGS